MFFGTILQSLSLVFGKLLLEEERRITTRERLDYLQLLKDKEHERSVGDELRITDREHEIELCKPEEFWSIASNLQYDDKLIKSKLSIFDGGKIVESGLPDEIFSNPQEIRTKEFLKKFINNIN